MVSGWQEPVQHTEHSLVVELGKYQLSPEVKAVLRELVDFSAANGEVVRTYMDYGSDMTAQVHKSTYDDVVRMKTEGVDPCVRQLAHDVARFSYRHGFDYPGVKVERKFSRLLAALE